MPKTGFDVREMPPKPHGGPLRTEAPQPSHEELRPLLRRMIEDMRAKADTLEKFEKMLPERVDPSVDSFMAKVLGFSLYGAGGGPAAPVG